ncbi:MAG: hypothetical protein DWQ18_05190 [Crenarchaeota archaeon]|nr:MAG: hypothetical protein DWQ17_07940 [Thermoproteota archaeon]RDJ34281.1 MAG: hypothetical protein DWQ18_05190 [Thermoproteota archaeon]RDJ36606.1 MAG: hypothetical protein DWQ13_05420 [Thermoproteota archaeon]RDJ37865.1 MAG: hypothetical protein DWQ19_05415 [Thermoproteota archaeon]
MTTFSEFNKELEKLVESFSKKGVQLKIEKSDDDIIKIFGENINSLSRAQNGLEDVTELSYTTAEHHPYWNLLYHCTQISKNVLDKWNTNLNNDDLDEIRWSITEMQNSCDKISQGPHDE